VASEALEYLSLAALPVPGSSRPLVDAHEIVYLPSASALGAVRSRTATARGAIPRLAIIADPVFDLLDPRLPRNQRRAAASGAATAPLTPPLARAIRGIALDTPLDRRLSRLTFSRLEASAIARLLPAPQVRLATGFAASREAVTTAALGTADIVHLATHGLVSTSQPALTGLVVSLVDAHGQARDGFVRLSDVYNLRLAADMVVLSACHTALGTEVRGEGLVGLTRGFMYAGARRVVASLWAVDDSATAELMSRFYRGLLRDGLPAAAALRAAQRELASRPQWAAPYYWAGFVLQGDWQ
jgi:CHAT domain-containing protein